MRIAHERKLPSVRTLLGAFALLVTTAALVSPAAAQLTNPGFDSGPTGFVGNFGTVVGPPFQAGFWGAEDADIINVIVCYPPQSPSNLLRLNVGGGSYSQAWQAVDVSTGTPAAVTMAAYFNTCAAGAGSVVGVAIRTFNNANGWPTHTLYLPAQIALDADEHTWERVALECVAIPADTKWILAEVFMANATSNNVASGVDDASLTFDPCTIPVRSTTWGAVKALYR